MSEFVADGMCRLLWHLSSRACTQVLGLAIGCEWNALFSLFLCVALLFILFFCLPPFFFDDVLFWVDLFFLFLFFFVLFSFSVYMLYHGFSLLIYLVALRPIYLSFAKVIERPWTSANSFRQSPFYRKMNYERHLSFRTDLFESLYDVLNVFIYFFHYFNCNKIFFKRYLACVRGNKITVHWTSKTSLVWSDYGIA